MESQDIVQNLIDTLGQSQRRRFPPALAQNYIEIAERDDARLLAHLKRLAAHVRFYPEDGGAPGDWQDFFPFEADEVREWIDALGADTRPQLALLLAFFEVYRQPQALLNGLTARHLDFFYRDVLRLESRPAVPDRAHLLLGLKKNTQPVKIGPAHQFSAGKDATGVERSAVISARARTQTARAWVSSSRSPASVHSAISRSRAASDTSPGAS